MLTARTEAIRSNYRASAAYVTGTHSTKVGMTLTHQWRYATTEVNNSVTLTVRGKQPFSLTEYATPIQYHETVNYNMGLFAQDQWTVKRLTANYGVRLDFLKASVDPQDIAAGPFTPARHYDGISNVPNWKDISPRLGAAYDLFGNGKTALKASFGRYVVADAYTVARAVNPETTAAPPTTQNVECHDHLQSIQRLQPQEPGREWFVRADQQPGLRHVDGAGHHL